MFLGVFPEVEETSNDLEYNFSVGAVEVSTFHLLEYTCMYESTFAWGFYYVLMSYIQIPRHVIISTLL